MAKTMAKPVTMKDVAAQAGVSVKTVSRVVNDQGEIAETTREHVRKVIEQMGYRPNALARSLITGQSRSVGLLIPDVTDPFFPDVVLGVEQVAREHGFGVFLCNTSKEPTTELEYVDLLIAKRVDGLMICGSRLDEEGLMYVKSCLPAVILTPFAISNASLLTIDSYWGSREITRHLLSLGHRHIGHLRGDAWHSSSAGGRYAGFVAALDEAGLPSADAPVVTVGRFTQEEGYHGALQLLEANPDITALVCYNDLVAIGAMEACVAVGRRVPEDISVTGFDDIPAATMVRPRLTTMHINRREIGRVMMTTLLSVIANGTPPERQIIRPQLVVRESTAAPGYAKREQ